VYAVQFVGMMSWLPSFFIEEAGFGAGLAAVTTAGIVALNAVGCPIGGWLLRFASRSALLGVTAATVGMLAVLVFDSGVGDDLKIAQAALGSLVGPPAVAAVVAWTGGWGQRTLVPVRDGSGRCLARARPERDRAPPRSTSAPNRKRKVNVRRKLARSSCH